MAISTAAILGGAALTGGLAGGSSLLAAAIGKRGSDYAAKKAAEAQERVNAQQIAFAREQNEITRQREDTAHQREVADLMAAGLSPLGSMSGSSASSGLSADLSSEGFSRAAELQAQGYQGFGNAVTSTFGSFQNAVQNYTQLKNAQVGETVGNSQAAFNNQKAEETSINNSSLALMNFDKILELEEKIENLRKNNVIDGAKADKAKDFVEAEINNMSANASNARAQAALHEQKRRFNQEDEEFFNDLGIPKSTSVSFGATSIPGVTQVTTRNAARMAVNGDKSQTNSPDLATVARETADAAAMDSYRSQLRALESQLRHEKEKLRGTGRSSNETIKSLEESIRQFKENGLKKTKSLYYKEYGLTDDGKYFRKD